MQLFFLSYSFGLIKGMFGVFRKHRRYILFGIYYSLFYLLIYQCRGRSRLCEGNVHAREPFPGSCDDTNERGGCFYTGCLEMVWYKLTYLCFDD